MADGVGGMVVDGGSLHLTLSSLGVLAFHGGGVGAGVHGRVGDRGDILLDRTAMAPHTVTTAGMAMEILATVMETVTDLPPAPAMQANTAPQLDRG